MEDAMDYAKERWMKVYVRDTASWLAKSWQARGLGILLDRHAETSTGEISLGSKGLPAVAALLRAPWDELKGPLQELLDEGDFEYDEERQVLRDPQHAARQGAETSSTVRSQQHRARGSTAKPRDATPCNAAQRDATPCNDKRERETEEKESERETRARAPEDPSTPDEPPAPEPPSGNMFGIGPEGTPLAGMLVPLKPPEWFHDVVGTVRVHTGEDIDARVAWSRYSAHRAARHKPMSPADAQYFVTTVDVVEARKERAERRDRQSRIDEVEHRQAARARRGMSPPVVRTSAVGRLSLGDCDAHVHAHLAVTRERELAAVLGGT